MSINELEENVLRIAYEFITKGIDYQVIPFVLSPREFISTKNNLTYFIQTTKPEFTSIVDEDRIFLVTLLNQTRVMLIKESEE